jgi:DNA-binding FadR family transcriptional regulator
LADRPPLLAAAETGTYVAEIDLDAVFAVRLQLEPHAARLAAVERSSAEMRLLSALATGMLA